jgi:hypothetical protein
LRCPQVHSPCQPPRELILNYFSAKKQFSSGVIEASTTRARLTMRKSHGFRAFHVTEIALYHALGKLPVPETTHRLTRMFWGMPNPPQLGGYQTNIRNVKIQHWCKWLAAGLS